MQQEKQFSLRLEESAARKAKEQIIYTGFIAQDVEKAAKKLSYDFSGVDAAKNDKDLYGLRYSDFVVPLVKAVQELSNQNDTLKEKNNALQSLLKDVLNQLKEIKTQLATVQSVQQQCCSATSTTQLINNDVALKTNNAFSATVSPNPATNIATLRLNSANNADVNITDANGKLIWQKHNINTTQVQISMQQFAAGIYFIKVVNANQTQTLKLVKE